MDLTQYTIRAATESRALNGSSSETRVKVLSRTTSKYDEYRKGREFRRDEKKGGSVAKYCIYEQNDTTLVRIVAKAR